VSNILSIILGGGKGTRLFPLTEERSKPAVPFGGKYRLVDIPISNSINSNLRQINVLTQFNSASLHMHISQAYQFDTFSGGFVEILAAEQTFAHSGWFKGTADAVRKNLPHFRPHKPDMYLILSGDQLYSMDLEAFCKKHKESGADVTIASTAVNRHDASELGILKVDEKGDILDFFEKPGFEKNIDDLKIPAKAYPENSTAPSEDKDYLGSMGIYIFNADIMEKCLDNEYMDFGKEIIPIAIKEMNVKAYFYDGFWEDIGTLKSFYDSNLNLAAVKPLFNLYDSQFPIYTRKRDLPPSKLNACTISHSIATEGSIISDAYIYNSLVGIRTLIERGASLDGVICMGADYYESDDEKEENRKAGRPNLGIGSGTIIKNAIIDKNTRIGNNCRIGVEKLNREDGDYKGYYIREGLIIIPKNGIIEDGTSI